LHAGARCVTICGGGGSDGILFYNAIAGVVVDLEHGTILNDGFASGDVVASIEEVQASSASDNVTLTSGHNLAFGRSGDDTLYGLAGSDDFIGGSGFDVIYGGAD